MRLLVYDEAKHMHYMCIVHSGGAFDVSTTGIQDNLLDVPLEKEKIQVHLLYTIWRRDQK